MFLRHTILYLPAQFVSTIFQFLAIIVWTHFLEPADLGRFNLVVAVQELVFLLMLWWSFYTLRSIGEWSEEEQRRRFQRTESFVLACALGLQIVVVSVLVVTTVDRAASAALVATSVVFAVSRSLVAYISERTRTAHQIGLYTILQISWSVIGFGLGVILVFMFGSSAVWPLLGTAVAQLLAAVYVMWRAGVRFFSFRPDSDILVAAMKFGFPLVVGGVLSWVSMFGNRFIIEYFLDYAEVGLFSVGNGLADRSVTFAMTLVSTATLPLAIQDMRESGTPEAMLRLKQGSIAALGLMIPTAVGISVLAVPIAEILVGQQYRDATVLLLPVAACSAVVYGAWCALPAQALLLLKEPGLLVRLSSAMAILTIILGIVLIQWFGILGVAYARLAALSLVFVIACQICMSRIGMPFPGRELIKMCVCAGVMAAALWVVPRPHSLVGLFIVVALGAAVYLSSAALLFRNEIKPIAGRWLLRFKT